MTEEFGDCALPDWISQAHTEASRMVPDEFDLAVIEAMKGEE